MRRFRIISALSRSEVKPRFNLISGFGSNTKRCCKLAGIAPAASTVNQKNRTPVRPLEICQGYCLFGISERGGVGCSVLKR